MDGVMNAWKSGDSWPSEKLWVFGVEPFSCEYVCHMSSETERGRTAEGESLWEGTARDRKADLERNSRTTCCTRRSRAFRPRPHTHTRDLFPLFFFFFKAFCSASRLQKNPHSHRWYFKMILSTCNQTPKQFLEKAQGSTTTTEQRGGHMCGLTMKLRYLWIWHWNTKHQKMPSDLSGPQYDGRVDGRLSGGI